MHFQVNQTVEGELSIIPLDFIKEFVFPIHKEKHMSKIIKGSKLAWLLLLALSLTLAACSSGSGGSQTVTITLSEMKVDLSQNTFTSGVAYHFVVNNKGTMTHELLLMGPTTDQASVTAQRQAALVTLTTSDLPAGGAKSFDYTFTKAAPAGTLEFACHLPGHYEAGMHTSITVK
jgi:uncharacterized cupredoxin-like copper-binding protein